MSDRTVLAGMGQRGPVRRDPLPLFGTDPAALAASVGDEPTEPLASAAVPLRDDDEPGPFPPPPDKAGVLVAAAWPLLNLLARLRGGATARPDELKEGCIAAIRRFENDALRGGAAADLVSAGRYALCSAIDEQVLGTPWGDASDWAAASLLSTFHNETWGGEKVFAIVEVAIAANGGQRDLALLLFYLLSLGFQGRFRVRRDGTAEVEALRERLYRVLAPGLGAVPAPPGVMPKPPPARSSRWGFGSGRRLRSWPPVWVVAAGGMVVGALLFVTYEALLQARAERLARALTGIDRPVAIANPPAPLAAPVSVPIAAGQAAGATAPASPLVPGGFGAEGTSPPAARPPPAPTPRWGRPPGHTPSAEER